MPHPRVPTRHQHRLPGYPNEVQGCRNEAPRSPQSVQKTLTVLHVIKTEAQNATMVPKITQSAKATPQGLAKCHKIWETSEGGKPKVQLGAVGRRPRQQGSDASSS